MTYFKSLYNKNNSRRNLAARLSPYSVPFTLWTNVSSRYQRSNITATNSNKREISSPLIIYIFYKLTTLTNISVVTIIWKFFDDDEVFHFSMYQYTTQFHQ